MDACFTDVTIEFLAVAFHNILYYTGIYPPNIFETRKKYNIVVHQSTHPEVNRYIDLCLRSIAECMNTGHLHRVELCVTDSSDSTVGKFAFDFDKINNFDETSDAYLVQVEENLRALCLKLSSVADKLKKPSEDRSFSIYIHTNEVTAVSISSNPDLEDFPLVLCDYMDGNSNSIIPLRRFSLRSYNIDAYIELS